MHTEWPELPAMRSSCGSLALLTRSVSLKSRLKKLVRAKSKMCSWSKCQGHISMAPGAQRCDLCGKSTELLVKWQMWSFNFNIKTF